MENKTKEQVDRQIAGLTKMKEWLPEYSMFGGANWEKIDAQISILKGTETLDDFEDEENSDDDTDEIYRAAQEAEDWLIGDTNEDLFEEK